MQTPNAEERELIGLKFWNGHMIADRRAGWADMREDEQQQAIAEWQRGLYDTATKDAPQTTPDAQLLSSAIRRYVQHELMSRFAVHDSKLFQLEQRIRVLEQRIAAMFDSSVPSGTKRSAVKYVLDDGRKVTITRTVE